VKKARFSVSCRKNLPRKNDSEEEMPDLSCFELLFSAHIIFCPLMTRPKL
jgi:hypothetical protein